MFGEVAQIAGNDDIFGVRASTMAVWNHMVVLQPEGGETGVLTPQVMAVPRNRLRIQRMGNLADACP